MHLQWMVGSPLCLVSHCPLYPTLVPSHRSVCTSTHNSLGHKWESESETHVLNWPRGSWAAGELAGEGDTGALMAWELHPFSFLTPRIAPVPGIALSRGAWAFTPCGRVTGVVMAFIRSWDRFFWEKVIEVHHGAERSGRPLLASHTYAKWTQQGGECAWLGKQDCRKEWETKTNWYGVTP